MQRQIQPLYPEIRLNVNSIQRGTQPLNQQIGFNVKSIQKKIQPLNHQIGFIVNCIQRHSSIKPSNRTQYQFHSITDSTLKP